MKKRIVDFLKRKFLGPEKYARNIGVNIGTNCRISTFNWGSEPYLIEIGNHVHITNNVQFINHDGGVWVFRNDYPGFDVFGKIKIGNNTYIGNNAVIMPGVTIGENCVIGVNSVVTKSIADNCVVAGIPAKFICDTKYYLEKMSKVKTNIKTYSNKEKRVFLINAPDNQFIKKNNLL
ncbi:MAG: acyltransferase [Bacteroidales bacterium]|nr:acyltransferase [Bacteroidales bacterium]